MLLSARRALHLVEIITVGFPFCAFKMLTGSALLASPTWRVAGMALGALGAVDLLLNGVNLAATLLGRESPVVVCSLEQAVTWLRSGHPAWRELGLSLDAMLAFTLVALMIGLHLLPRLSPAELSLWNVAVVCNVLGAGSGRLAASLEALKGVTSAA